MREIEFRIRHRDREWFYGVPLTQIRNGTVGFKSFNNDYYDLFADAETLGQFTGLKDKNGVKIYEGDIVKVEFNTFDDNGYVLSTQTITGEVYFDINEYAYKVLQHLGIFNDDSFEDYDSFKLYDCVGCEVIGNIYDNPELIKESE